MHVEFFGIPRQRAGVAEAVVHARTLGELFGTLAVRFPALADLIADDRLHPSLAANLNGDEFVTDPATCLDANDHVLIVSADAGG